MEFDTSRVTPAPGTTPADGINVRVSSEDRLECVAAFNERRAPRWRNR